MFVANKILAKHDENYMAPEVAEAIAQHTADKLSTHPVAPCDVS